MSLHAAMHDACRAIGIVPPARTIRGRWAQCPAQGKARTNTAGRVFMASNGREGIAWNWITGERRAFSDQGAPGEALPPRKRDLEAERRREAEAADAARICNLIVTRADRRKGHAYLARKGFPAEIALVHDDVRSIIPHTPIGRRIAAALPQTDEPLLIVPGRVGADLRTVQFIAADGTKKNILAGRMSGACYRLPGLGHRLATGARTVVCEGIATALSVRAALGLLGASCAVLSAFSASNVAAVASTIPGALVLADNDPPLDQLGDLGTGEFYARRSGCRWSMPPKRGDFNDWHQQDGLRAVALHLREALAA